jgi:hypothetical protein
MMLQNSFHTFIIYLPNDYHVYVIIPILSAILRPVMPHLSSEQAPPTNQAHYPEKQSKMMSAANNPSNAIRARFVLIFVQSKYSKRYKQVE